MATLAYALRTEQREDSPSGTSASTGKPGSTAWLDAVAALVPAEVLALHALAVSQFTKTHEVGEDAEVQIRESGAQAPEVIEEVTDETGVVTTITDPTALKWSFWALVAGAAVLYLVKKGRRLNWLDAGRVLFPPIAFVLWTMLTPNSAFDAAFPGEVSEARRVVIAAAGAAVVAGLARWLAEKADQRAPSPVPADVR
jgi:hypothetical protein